MTDRPIAFSPPMVRALLAGTKTQTRRLFKGIEDNGKRGFHVFGSGGGVYGCTEVEVPGYAVNCLRIAVGDRLYVREAWRSASPLDDTAPRDMSELLFPPIRYEADGETVNWKEWRGHDAGRLRQGMHMPRWASRLTLIVTDVRVQRLQEISREDAIAEGMIQLPHASALAREMGCDWGYEGDSRYGSPVSAYAALWDRLNAESGFGWNTNPWVVAYGFNVHRGNIDQIGGAA